MSSKLQIYKSQFKWTKQIDAQDATKKDLCFKCGNLDHMAKEYHECMKNCIKVELNSMSIVSTESQVKRLSMTLDEEVDYVQMWHQVLKSLSRRMLGPECGFKATFSMIKPDKKG